MTQHRANIKTGLKIQACFNIRLRALSAFSGRDFPILLPLFLAGRVPFLFGFLVPLFFSSIILHLYKHIYLKYFANVSNYH